jgi:Family of unknown function (DUF5715)
MTTSPSARARVLLATTLLSVVAAGPAYADAPAHVRELDRMMTAMAVQSASDAATIKRVYRPHLSLLLLNEYSDLASALATGGLALLPAQGRFNLAPRLEGLHPIGEKDLPRQATYLSARPATIGALILVASRVRSGPLEITSLVRHTEYQADLRATNMNASTSVPMHTMGLAFDIALVNAPLQRVREIKRVLQEMRAAGDILFIGERQQLVFHVVPHPSRLGYFADIYMQAVGAVSVAQAVEVVAPGPPRVRALRTAPRVVTDVVAITPLSDGQEERSTAVTADSRVADESVHAPTAAMVPLTGMVLLRGALAFLAALVTSACRIARRSRMAEQA